MNTRWSFAVATVAFMVAISASAQSTTVGSVCKDGTSDATVGRGACSRHGGVDKSATAKAQAAAKASAKASAKAAAKTTAASTATVTCKDGSTSSGGRGACAHHGGVAPATAASVAATAPRATPKTKSAPKLASTPAATRVASTSKSSKSPNMDNTDPTGATALCKDGTYSHAQHHTGACGHHGGVDKWM